MKLYIAGPMRGYPQSNFIAFDLAAKILEGLGHTPINPADHDRTLGFDGEHGDVDMRSVVAWDLSQVAMSDGLVVLAGWENSTGAKVEVRTALWLGLPIYRLRGGKLVQLRDPEAWL